MIVPMYRSFASFDPLGLDDSSALIDITKYFGRFRIVHDLLKRAAGGRMIRILFRQDEHSNSNHGSWILV